MLTYAEQSRLSISKLGPGQIAGWGPASRPLPRPVRFASGMGVDAYQTNQTSRTTFSASQSAAPVKVPPPHPVAAPLAECRPSERNSTPLDHVPPLGWALPPIKCRP